MNIDVFFKCVVSIYVFDCYTNTIFNNLTITLTRESIRGASGILRRDRKKNTWVRKNTKVTDVIGNIKQSEWQRPGHDTIKKIGTTGIGEAQR